ncbi:tyrosine-type recombinase/integrase [Desulfotruncus alcoholivorax]|uniref:tyrosine-type recombinase/integrase n=1 Tax=Desulfotruncus alcoholivorax TaxID=265477 RepID=UPI000424E221|nr:tyrosine-type recombinase/integrase [Desulfotruncus alcoholivorax]
MDVQDKFKSYLQGRGLSRRTIRTYITTLNRFTKWIEQVYGEFDVAAITPLDVADYRRYLNQKGKKPATVNHALDVLNCFFAWANAEGNVQTNPVAGIKRMREQKNAPRWLGRRELGALIRAVQKYGKSRDIALVMLLIHTGLRISEAVSLRQGDIVLRERSGLVRVRQGKGDKYREVPLNITVRRVLDGYIGETKGEWLFPSRRGGHISTRAAENILTKYGRLAGLDVTPHMLRHTFGKMLVDAGESLDRVAALMGHSNLNTTARYTRPSAQDLEYAVEKLAWE